MMWNDVADVLVQLEALIVPFHMYAVKVSLVTEFSSKRIHMFYTMPNCLTPTI